MPILALRLGRPGAGDHGAWFYHADQEPDAEGLIECPSCTQGTAPGSKPLPPHNISVGINPGGSIACHGWLVVRVNALPMKSEGASTDQ